ncbi:PEPTIDE-N4-(N-ACETYL-BETA-GLUCOSAMINYL)ASPARAGINEAMIDASE A PROTEIN [Ceraceosorus bombacis]|uniref:PEPTIDE-N4-(N-ACETYL-BETA-GLUCOSAMINYL)ASPARAGINE AMIDASE A PROTEIN n=1 Tax=Ceraceosorus bombacis TaxID=401625 RepID=A0A0P1BDC7_9BASI|nr:PEPTIDE-N4-(N-ACETYL-BETA-GLUCOSAMINYL)ASPARAGINEAMIDASE A PROTEIN [Ceraceosorus bombacis]
MADLPVKPNATRSLRLSQLLTGLVVLLLCLALLPGVHAEARRPTSLSGLVQHRRSQAPLQESILYTRTASSEPQEYSSGVSLSLTIQSEKDPLQGNSKTAHSNSRFRSQSEIMEVGGETNDGKGTDADTGSGASTVQSATPQAEPSSTATPAPSPQKPQPLLNFEPAPPSRLYGESHGLKNHTIVLIRRVFGNSYGKPSVLKYSPKLLPAEFSDPLQWRGLLLRQDGVSIGRQFDRLGSVQIGGTEIWRTDNAEPRNVSDTTWSTEKQVDQYFDLFKQDRNLVFDYPNIVDATYTGYLNITLSLTVSIADPQAPRSEEKANAIRAPLVDASPMILPLAKGFDDDNAFFELGGPNQSDTDGSTKVRFPSNAATAIVEIFASGTAQEEFWYTNLPDAVYNSSTSDLSSVGMFRHGPYRELQLSIDGKIAGIILPYPVIFTGGIQNLIWRPQAAYGAYNQPTYHIDITPFLGSLTDGQEHDIKLGVVSGEEDRLLGTYWFVTGNIQVVLDTVPGRTTGALHKYVIEGGDLINTGSVEGNLSTNGSFTSFTRSRTPRTVLIEARIRRPSRRNPSSVIWSQTLSFENSQKYASTSAANTINQKAHGSSNSMHAGATFLASTFSYPLDVTYNPDYTKTSINHTYFNSLQLEDPKYAQPQWQTTSVMQTGSVDMGPDKNTGGLSVKVNARAETNYEDANKNSFKRITVNKWTSDGKVARFDIVSDEIYGTLKPYAQPVQTSPETEAYRQRLATQPAALEQLTDPQ